MRKQTLRHFAFACLALLACALPVAPAHAQPSQIKIVVPYTPGTGPDILSRLMADEIGRAQSVTVLVENRPGGGTLVGTDWSRAPPGRHHAAAGRQLVRGQPGARQGQLRPHELRAGLLPRLDPVGACGQGRTRPTARSPTCSRRRATSRVTCRSRAADRPRRCTSPSRWSGARPSDMTYVPYGGTAPAINALMGGHVTSVFADYPTVVAQLKSGTLRGLVTTSPARVPPLPDVPTLAETGLTKYEAEIFYGIVAPAKTPPMCSPSFRTGSSPRSMRPRRSRSSPRRACSRPASAARRSASSCESWSPTTRGSSREAGIKAE